MPVLNMQLKKKVFLILAGIFIVVTVFFAHVGHWIPFYGYNNHKNIFEYDEYGDGDYDEKSRFEAAKRLLPKWNYTKENIGIFIRPRLDWMVMFTYYSFILFQ
jgi:hypothetical protein